MKENILEKVLWDIEKPEKLNIVEAYYIDLLIRLAERELKTKLNKILDIPCGVGRHHKYLREVGYDVFGVDVNPNFIKECKEKFPEFKDKYFVGDMRKINFKEEFDVILNWFNSFSYFSHDENLEVLNNFHRALRDNGLLILNTATAGFIENHPILKGLIGEEFSINDGKYVLISRFADLKKVNYGYKMKSIRSIYKERGNDLIFIKSFSHEQLFYYPKVVAEMLRNTGFEILFAFPGKCIVDYSNNIEGLNKYSSVTVVARKV